MYIVELGLRGGDDYYKFEFNSYTEAEKFISIIIDNGYSALVSFENNI